jgi:hypothetical protein
MGAALLADPGLVANRTTVVGAAERASHASRVLVRRIVSEDRCIGLQEPNIGVAGDAS